MKKPSGRHQSTRFPPLLAVLACFAWAVCMFAYVGMAAAEQDAHRQVDPHFGAEDDAFLNRQAATFLADVAETLARVKPSAPEPRERYLALRLLDAVLHDEYAPNRSPVQEFFHTRIEQAAAEIETARVGEGALIWKLYNHGFVVRTRSVTLAFDVHSGPAGFRTTDRKGKRAIVPCPGFPISNEVMLRIAHACDVLFISHAHGDHASKPVAQAFIDQGKPVVAPDTVFAGSSIHEEITHMKREAHTLQTLPIQGGKVGLRVAVYPGQQYQGRGVPNNVVLIFTPESLSFAHNGDQINDPYPQYQEDYAWIDKVHEHHKVDVYMTNCWGNDLFRDVRGFDPRLVLPGHENEMGHPVWDRVPYWGDSEYLHITYPQLKASEYPVVVMTWGESYHYRPAEK